MSEEAGSLAVENVKLTLERLQFPNAGRASFFSGKMKTKVKVKSLVIVKVVVGALSGRREKD